MKYLLIFMIMYLFIFLQGCSDEITSPIENGSIIVAKVKVGLSDQLPRDVVKIDLKIIDKNTTSLKTIKTSNSDSEGVVIFNNLE